MPQWAGSCWYYLRFLDPRNDRALVDPEVEKAWMPVDLYVGGAEHAVLHLLYARFWHKVLFDRGYVGTPEPFQKLVNQGMILGEDGGKMSKSRGNVVNPDQVVKEYGADALRLYEMFMGPLEAVKPWSMDGVSGVRGFLDRAWRMIVDDRAETMQLAAAVRPAEPTPEQNRMVHKTIQAVTRDLEQMSFNTAIARMMEFTNFFLKEECRPPLGDGAIRAAAVAVGAARCRGALAGVGRTTTRWPTSRGRGSTSRNSARRRSRFPCRSTASFAGGSAWPPVRQRRVDAAAQADERIAELAGRQDGGQGDRGAGPDGEFRGEVNIWHNAGNGRGKRLWRHGASLVCHGCVSRADLVRPLHG